ncbi:hypothetical protein TNCV_774881 [Trichonephila clavipes]|nr:hypothetical protein TNCV_774881 [Trichonephila clavipes]
MHSKDWMIFFTSLNPENIDSSTSAIRDINSESPPLADGSLIIKSLQENECVFRNDLNNCVYLRCELYKGIFKIHIRKFLIIESDVKPTFNGVAMDLHSWFDFFRKIFNFNLLYSSSSFVANNTILVTNTNSEMTVKNLQTNAWIALDDDQLNNLKHCAHDLNEELIDYLYSNYLPKVILKNYTPNCEKINDELSLMKSLIVSIEESVEDDPLQSVHIHKACRLTVCFSHIRKNHSFLKFSPLRRALPGRNWKEEYFLWNSFLTIMDTLSLSDWLKR